MLRRRPDATLAEDVPRYRRIMPFLMRGRNESAVYFEQQIELAGTEAFLDRFRAQHPATKATVFHVVLWAAARVLHQRPRLNRFVAGGRLWQRDGVWLSFSAKKRMGDDDAPLVLVKRRFDEGEEPKRTVTLRYTYDERVEDGLYAQRGLELLRRMVEDPEAHGA